MCEEGGCFHPSASVTWHCHITLVDQQCQVHILHGPRSPHDSSHPYTFRNDSASGGSNSQVAAFMEASFRPTFSPSVLIPMWKGGGYIPRVYMSRQLQARCWLHVCPSSARRMPSVRHGFRVFRKFDGESHTSLPIGAWRAKIW